MILKKQKVLQKTLQQRFTNCDEATLTVSQKDIMGGMWLFFGVYVKTITVTCNATGDKIKKQQWNEQTKAEATALSQEYKVSKGGRYFIIAFLLLAIFLVSGGIINGIVKTNTYSRTYRSKTREEQKELLSKLDVGDLIKSMNAVYRIESKEAQVLMVTKSDRVEDIRNVNDPIDEADYPSNSFDSNEAVQINMQAFLNNTSVNTNLEYELGGEHIMNILDR